MNVTDDPGKAAASTAGEAGNSAGAGADLHGGTPEQATYRRDHHHESEADFVPGALADAAIVAEEVAGDVGNGSHD